MAKWNHQVYIKRHLTGSTEWADLAAAANAIAKELRKLPESVTDGAYDFIDDIEFLEGVSESDCEVYANAFDLQSEINGRLSSIYDFADAQRIWLG